MAPTIHNPDDLTPEARLIIERKQFQPPLPHMHAQYLRWQLECDYIYGDSPRDATRQSYDLVFDSRNDGEIIWKTVRDSSYPISRKQWASLISTETAEMMRPSNYPMLIEAYIMLFCTHINRVRGDAKRLLLQESSEDEARQRKRSRSPAARRIGNELVSGIRLGSPQRRKRFSLNVVSNISPSCKVLSGTDLLACFPEYTIEDPQKGLFLDEKALDDLLLSINCTADNFRELDYLFIPVVDDYQAHAFLMGLAPKQKYAFRLNSCDSSIELEDRWWGVALMAIIHRLDPTIKTNTMNRELNVPESDRSKYWYLFGQYPRRTHTNDGSPDGPQQRDYYNCGVFTMTSAFCLAFGYSLMCWQQLEDRQLPRDLDYWKKARIIFEMETEDFSATNDFDYDLLEIPQDEIQPLLRSENVTPSVYSDSDPESPKRFVDLTPDHGPMDEDEEEAGKLEYGDGDEEDDDDDDMNEAYRIERLDVGLGYITDEGEEGSDGEDFATEDDASRAFLTAKEAIERENPRVAPMSDDLPWPAQMPAEPEGYFQRSGFIYPAPDVNFQPELNYSKRELKKACRDFPLVGWKSMSRQSQPLFLQWMLNEMAATISLIRGDAIEPFFHLARGYKDRV
ncbi:hypothetical protein WAI453_007177 [Rhynchosporium graminicola]|uniref:Ubiquitin-like protease family profile domain-containing protein n=1 Tax=Rhynchosporium graminicola TaxID=2792576 RepID=A0A1E1LDC2_9HELO|nr:uncharacterized protein RCO7_08156 [Rhynchosporium commune]